MSKQKCSIEQGEVIAVLETYVKQYNEAHERYPMKSINSESIQSLLGLYGAVSGLSMEMDLPDWNNLFLQMVAGYTALVISGDEIQKSHLTEVSNAVYYMQELFKAIQGIQKNVEAFKDSTSRYSK